MVCGHELQGVEILISLAFMVAGKKLRIFQNPELLTSARLK
jgi:hypothetical protein